ncbi:MaoC family dehydratase [Ottowia testudinis]|uniref:MaoC family dehydratase n=1 Tax=Ottowia testudinis TaxID=2816950 RepID=A0A975H5S9_9BURK|nr:MaoC family dehydratase [Ottowia testudinis]QTD45272.1 MaoC family dehydratase [Ottowia testudinis]
MPDHPQHHIKYFWEDLPVGKTLDIGSITVNRDEVIAFASQYDPQPFHLDDAAAAKSMFGKLSASGWHTCAMAMGLMVRGFLHESSSLGSPGLEKLKWLKPVYPGDTLTLKQTITESRPMASRPDVGLTRTLWEMFNQHGEQVLMMDGYGMFRRRVPDPQ